jgi:hypothetical protein
MGLAFIGLGGQQHFAANPSDDHRDVPRAPGPGLVPAGKILGGAGI